MPRELITIQVGQCGNQIGCRFWDMALREHAAHNPKGRYDEALSSFFRNVDSRFEPPQSLPVGDGRGSIRSLKARAVLVDMEEGVTNDLLRGPLGEVFDQRQLITGVSGSGNNWAHGHHHYGPRYREELLEKIRTPVEEADSLQSFLLLHSLGGGTGSGVGTYILGLLEDEFPDVYRFTCSVFPSEDDDVITSPYNAMLSLAELTEHADCVLPIENASLSDICGRIADRFAKQPSKQGSSLSGMDAGQGGKAGHGGAPFDGMNGVAASLLLNLTSSVRFDGPLNVDLNEITMNLVPFPRLHFLLSAMAPLCGSRDMAKAAPTARSIDHLFTDVFAREHCLIRSDPRRSTYLACALLLRGPATIADVGRNVAKLKSQLKFVKWNPEGFKVGLCSVPPAGLPYSLLQLGNNCCIRNTFTAMEERFQKLYKKKVYLHHYTQYMDASCFDQAAATVRDLVDEYAALDGDGDPAAAAAPHMHPVGVDSRQPSRESALKGLQ